jgi:hypothetical protein
MLSKGLLLPYNSGYGFDMLNRLDPSNSIYCCLNVKKNFIIIFLTKLYFMDNLNYFLIHKVIQIILDKPR